MKRTIHACLAIFSAALVSSRSLEAQHPSVPACYQFDRKYFNWVGRPPNGGSVVVDSSAIIRLDSTAHSRERGAYPPPDGRAVQVPSMKADSFTMRRWLGMSFWRPIRSDSIELSWRNGLYGPVFRLALRSDSLVGRVRFTTDVVGAEPPAQLASASRIRCP